MDHAYRGMQEAMESVTIAPDMGEEELRKRLSQIWHKTAAYIAECREVKEDSALRDAYRVLLDQARYAALEFRFLDQPALSYIPDQNRKKQGLFSYLFLMPAIALSVGAIIFGSTNHDIGIEILGILAAAAFLVYLVLSIRYMFRAKKQTGTVHAEQRINLAALKNSMEKIARRVDTGAAGLYAMLQQHQSGGEDSLDGMELIKRILKINYEGEPVPESMMTQVRLYLNDCHVEMLDYTPERASLFTLLPSNGVKTLQPALVRKVKAMENGEACEREALVQMGVACVNMDEMM